MDDTEGRRLRHDLRNTFNQLGLLVQVLGVESEPAERLRWLDAIESTTGIVTALTEKIEALSA